MRHSLRFIFAAAVFALAVSPVTTGFAAPATWERVDVTQHSEQGGGVLLVSGELPATASLPADAQLSVPAGSGLQWIGEILGGASADDPELKFTKTTVNGNDLYRFTLTKSRTAQIEVPTSRRAGLRRNNVHVVCRVDRRPGRPRGPAEPPCATGSCDCDTASRSRAAAGRRQLRFLHQDSQERESGRPARPGGCVLASDGRRSSRRRRRTVRRPIGSADRASAPGTRSIRRADRGGSPQDGRKRLGADEA